MGSSSCTSHSFHFKRYFDNFAPQNVDNKAFFPDLGDSDTAHSRLKFDVELLAPSLFSLELPRTDQIVGRSRWVTVNVDSGFTFKIFMRHKHGIYQFGRGFSILSSSECLCDQQIASIEMVTQDEFNFSVHHNGAPNDTIGFNTYNGNSEIRSWVSSDYIVRKGTRITDDVKRAMNQCWAASPSLSMMYVCTVAKSNATGGSMVFASEYSRTLPKRIATLALRCIGSPVIIPGAIEKNCKGIARVSGGWSMFAKEHYIVAGEVVIIRIHRGPKGWEMLAWLAGVHGGH